MQICSELLIEKMFYCKFFCQTIQCPQKEGGRIPPPSDVSPTEKHADVIRVKKFYIKNGFMEASSCIYTLLWFFLAFILKFIITFIFHFLNKTKVINQSKY